MKEREIKIIKECDAPKKSGKTAAEIADSKRRLEISLLHVLAELLPREYENVYLEKVKSAAETC